MRKFSLPSFAPHEADPCKCPLQSKAVQIFIFMTIGSTCSIWIPNITKINFSIKFFFPFFPSISKSLLKLEKKFKLIASLLVRISMLHRFSVIINKNLLLFPRIFHEDHRSLFFFPVPDVSIFLSSEWQIHPSMNFGAVLFKPANWAHK